MAINFIKKEDLSHITRTTRQWETTIDRYEIIPKGVLCIELCNDKLTKIKIGNGHLIYEQLPYVSDVNLSDYYTKEETNTLLKNLKSIKIKGEASSLSDLPLRGNEDGDLWFVKKPDPDTHSRYDEYVWYNNKWESFGSSDIDLSEYAKKSYVDEHIQEVQNEITEIIESGYLHKHDNKDILDHTSAVYNVEKDNKLRDLHNYDDTELREKAHTHLNKNILDQTDAVYNRDKDDKLRGLHNYDDTSVKDRLSSLESVAHSHENQDVLNRTTAAFTREQAMILLDCKDFKGTDGVHDGYHGFVPAPTTADVGKVLGANGQWVENGSGGGGDVVAEGGGISITTDQQTGVKTVSVNAGTGLEIDQQTGELNVTATGGDSIAEGNGIDITTDSQTGVKTISVDIGDGLQFNQNSEIDINTGDGLSINQNNELDINTGDGLQINQNNELEVNTGDGLSINNNNAIELNKATTTTIGGIIVGDNLSIDNTGTLSADEYTPGEGISIDSNKEVSVKYNSDGLSINASDELELDKATTTDIGGVIVGDNIDVNNGTISVPKAASNKLGVIKPSDGLSVDSNGVLTVDTGDGLSIDSTTKEVNVNIGDGLVIDSNDNTLNVNIGSGLEIDSVTGAINVIGGGGNNGNYIEGEAIEFEESASRLPTGYTELENISNVSASYIDTGYIPNTDTQLSIIANIHRGTTSWQTLFGARDAVNPGGTEYAFFVRLNDNYNFYPRITGDQYTYMPNQTYDEKIRININNTTATVTRQDGSSYSYTQTGSLSNLSTTLAIFALHNQTGYVDNGIIDLYSFKIYENNTIVKDFVPCKRNSDDAVGLIDIINNVFYTNLGTGTFTAGRILTNTSINVKYGDGLSVNASNELEVAAASASTLGGVKIGDNLSIDSNGVLSANVINYSSGHAIEIVGDLSIDKFRWEITANAGDSMVAFRYFEYSDSDHIAFTIQAGTIEWSDGSTVSYPSGYDETFTGMMENRTKCTVTGWTGDKSLIMTFRLSQSISLSDIAYFRWKTDDYMSGRQPTEFNIYAHDSVNDEWILLKEVTDHALVPSSYNTWSDYIEIEPEIEPGAINVKYGDGLTVNQNNELEVNIGTGLQFDSNGAIEVTGGSGDSIDEGGGITITTDQQTGVKTIGVNAGIGLDIDLVTGELFVNGQLPEGTIIKKLTYVGDGSTTNSNIHFSKKPLSILSLNGSTGQNYGSVISTPIDAPYLHGVWGGSSGSGTSFRSSMSYDDTTNTLSIQNSTDVGLAFNLSGTTYTMFYLTKGHTGSGTSETNEVSVIRSFTYVGNGAGTIDIQFAETPDMIVSIHGPTSDGFITSSPVPITSASIAGIYEYGSASRYGGVVSCGMSFNDSTNILTLSGGVDAGARFNISGATYTVTYSVNETLSASLLNPGDGIDIDSENEISVKIGNHLSFDQTSGNINVDDIIEYTAGDGISITLADDIDVFNNGDGWENLCYSDSVGNSTTGNYQWEIHSPIPNSLTIPQGATQIKAVAKDTNDNLIWTSFSWIDSNDYHFASTSPNDGHYGDWFDIPSGSVKVNFGVRRTRLSTSQAISTSDVDSVTVMFDNGDTKRIDVNVGDGLFIDSTNNDVNVKIGQALSINNSNEIDVNLGRALSINNNNEIDVDIATANSLGVVKAGSGLNIDEYGNLSTQAAPFRIGRALSLDDESVRLPSAYYKAKYVQTDGQARCYTGFYPGNYPNAKYVGTASVIGDTYGYKYIFGTEGDNYNSTWSMILSTSSDNQSIITGLTYNNNNDKVNNPIVTAFAKGDMINFEASITSGLKINNELVQPLSTTFTKPTNEMFIFGERAGYNTSARLYSFKIYNSDDTLLANFVPAVRKSDNEVGFYEVVSNQFINSNYYGPPFTTDMDDLDVDDPDWVLNANIATSNSLGVVKPGTGMTVDEHGALNVAAYQLPTASASTLGGVKIGDGVDIDENGVISVDAMEKFVPGIGLEIIPGSSSEDALPEGYGKVDYVEAPCNAYTIIDYIPNRNSKVVGTSMMLNSTTDPVVFGARTSRDGQQFVFWFNKYSNTYAKVGFVYGTNTWSTSTDAADGRLIVYTVGTKFTYTISLEDELIIDDSFVHNITDNGTPANMKLGIFALTHTDTTIESDDTIFNGRMYDFKIYENNELVVNLVPAVRLLDEKVGFYDNIGNKFYMSLGSNQFTTDMSSIVIDYNETTMNVRLGEGLKTTPSNDITLDLHAGNGINMSAYGSDLPAGYGELSYIEGNGNQWTQLNYYPTHDSRLVVDCISYETQSTDRALFGCREGTGGQPQFVLWMGEYSNDNVSTAFVYGSNVWSEAYDTGVALGERFTIDASYNGVYINGDLFESITDQGNMPNLKVALFAVGNGDGSYISGKGMGKYRIFSFKIYEGNDLVVDLRPALSPIHTPGFYDVVNDAFYSSLTGTAFVYDSGSVVYPSGLQLTTKIGDGLAYDANGAITLAESADAFVAGDGIKFTNLSQTNKIKLVISAIRSTSQSGANAPYTQMRYIEFYDENLDPISIASGEAIWSDGTTVVYSEQIYSLSAMLSNTNKMCVCDYKPSLVLTFTLSSAMNAENIKYFRYKTGNDVSERDPVSWKIYVNDVNAQTSWTQISEAVSETITTSRDTWTQYFDCEFTAGGTTSISVRPATGSTLGGVIVGNGLTVTSDGTISTATGKAYIAGEGINMSSSQYEFSAENEQYLFRSKVTCELHGSFNREFQKTTDDTALGIIWNVYDSGTLWSGPIFVGLTSDSVKYTTNNTTYSALGTFSYLGKTWYYSDYQMYVSNIDGTDHDGNMVVDTETSASTSELVDFCKSLIDRARVILKVDEISLLPATEDTLGGIKIGEGLSIDENNVVSSTVYEEGQGIVFETAGSTDSFDVKNKQYYFTDEARCEITGNFGPRAYWRAYTDDPCLAVIFYRSDSTSMPLYIGLTENSVKMRQSWDGNVLGPDGTFNYKGYSWYYTANYGLYNSSGVDQQGHLQTVSGTSADEYGDVAKHVIDLAELISPGIKTYDVWNTGTGWLNGAYDNSQSDYFWTNWYYTYHSKQDEYLEVPADATKMRLIGISNENDSRLQGGGVDCFNSSHHHFATVGCITDEWADIPDGTVYLQFGVKWNELNNRYISSSDIKSVTLEIKVPKNNAITAKLGDGLTFDQDDAITLDESIKLIIHCVGSPIS